MKLSDFRNTDQLRDYSKANPIEHLVQGLLKEGTLNIASGEAKSGKSTLVRTLAVCVSSGRPFLGRDTKQGAVLYISPDETDTTELSLAFDALGAAGSNLLIYAAPVDKPELYSDLSKILEERPDVKLIVLDTLATTIEYEDLNSYDKVVQDLDPFRRLARSAGACIVVLHHTNKSSGQSIAKSLMGSGGLAGVAETIMEVSCSYERRYLTSSQRYRNIIPRTELLKDPETGAVYIEASEDEKKTRSAKWKKGDLTGKLLHFALREGRITRKSARIEVRANTQTVNRILEKQAELGYLVRIDGAKKSDPFEYEPSDRLKEEAAKIASSSSAPPVLKEAA